MGLALGLVLAPLIQAQRPPSTNAPPVEPPSCRVRYEASTEPGGLAAFVMERDGRFLATIPGRGRNAYGRPLFQNLQCSDTPALPLARLEFRDPSAKPGVHHLDHARAVHTTGTRSN